jgi:UDP-N-acetylglucosamine 2-epimerase (non-hydrolysing)
MACAIAAQKLRIPVAHVEAGIRSCDWTMPEEINRMVTDSITNWFFTTSEVANENLRRSGVPDKAIFFVGNTMIDTLLSNMERLKQPPFWGELGLEAGKYFVVTLHRPANVDAGDTFSQLLKAIGDTTRGEKVVFPVHPRTAKTLRDIGAVPNNLLLVEPQPYLEFNYLVKHAKESRRYVYSPSIPEKKAKQSALRQLLTTFFEGRPEKLVASLLDPEDQQLSKAEIERIRGLIDSNS